MKTQLQIEALVEQFEKSKSPDRLDALMFISDFSKPESEHKISWSQINRMIISAINSNEKSESILSTQCTTVKWHFMGKDELSDWGMIDNLFRLSEYCIRLESKFIIESGFFLACTLFSKYRDNLSEIKSANLFIISMEENALNIYDDIEKDREWFRGFFKEKGKQ